MTAYYLLDRGPVRVLDYRCMAGPDDVPFVEHHASHSLSYIRKGSFGCRSRGRSFELVAGSFLVGHPGDAYICSHEHHACGDECLSFSFAPELVEMLGGHADSWRMGALMPVAEMMVLGERAQAAADGTSDVGLAEAGYVMVARFVDMVEGRPRRCSSATARERRRAVETALWIDTQSAHDIGLEDMAQFAGVSAFHFLRTFAAVLGLTPHQYLVRCRLRRAARMLCERERPVTAIAFDSGFGDLSNFVRTFHRAAGCSPRAFRDRPARDRKILQERLT